MLTLILGSGVVAQEPSPTPLYAPEDMAFTIPTRVGSHDLEIVAAGLDRLAGSGEAREVWRDFLLPLGKEPSDVRIAVGVGGYSPPSLDGSSTFELAVAIMAVRVDGVPAEQVIDTLVQTVVVTDFEPPDEVHQEWQEVEGRRMQVVRFDDDPPQYMYPNGEVLFYITIADEEIAPTLSEVLAELP
jgi:hypothetical protein